MDRKTFLDTGGSGFIGTNFIRHVISVRPNWQIINLDSLTYAGNPKNLEDVFPRAKDRYQFIHGDIRDVTLLDNLFNQNNFTGVVHFAAESHVDRSILGPEAFVETNVIGTFRLLEASLRMWEQRGRQGEFRFLHVSTDEVYGSLGPEGYFTENTPYDPSSPYSASKAASDHFVRAYSRTYGLPTLITNCSNNYGPYQFPEKLIPLTILNAISGKPLPIYGKGDQIRDWIHVEDHAKALVKVLQEGKIGETYNIGGNNEKTNLEVVETICKILEELLPINNSTLNIQNYKNLITFVADRPGHDIRYAIDATKISNKLNWQPQETFETGIKKTVQWYLNNKTWWQRVQDGSYQGERLGLKADD